MFDFGSGELLVIGVVALVVIGPKELPAMLRTVGRTVARVRQMAGQFQGQFHDALREAELHDAVKSISDINASVADATGLNSTQSYFDPLQNLPMPSLPQAVIAPPAELQSPVKAEHPVSTVSDPKPKSSRAKKAKPVEEAARQDDPQAALFDTLDTMAKKAEAHPSPEPAIKKPRGSKKPKADVAAIAEAGPAVTKTEKSAKRKPKSKSGSDEVLS